MSRIANGRKLLLPHEVIAWRAFQNHSQRRGRELRAQQGLDSRDRECNVQCLSTDITVHERNYGLATRVLANYDQIQPPTDTSQVRIGNTLVRQEVDPDDYDQTIGQPTLLMIGGYGSSDLPREPGSPVVIAYDQMAGMAMMGKSVGDVIETRLGGNRRAFMITSIGLPSATGDESEHKEPELPLEQPALAAVAA